MEAVRIEDGEVITRPGIYIMPMKFYHSPFCCDGPSISSSGLRKIWSTSAAHFYDEWEGNPDHADLPDRPHFALGRAAGHLLTLGKAGFDAEYAVRPDEYPEDAVYPDPIGKKKPWSGNSLWCKAWLADHRERGFTIISKSELEDIAGISRSLMREPLVRAGIMDGQVERSLIYQDRETGVWVKTRPDVIPNDSGDYGDFKTCESVLDDALQRSITNFGYHQQGALVGEASQEVLGLEMTSFSLICAEKKRPYCTRVVTLKPEDLERGRNQNRVALNIFAKGVQTGEWPGPGNKKDAEYMGLQPYAQMRIDKRLGELMPEQEYERYLAKAEAAMAAEQEMGDDGSE